MNEKYLGTREDVKFVKSYLALMRSITPFEMFMTKFVRPLSELRLKGDDRIDFKLFDQFVTPATTTIKKEVSSIFETIPEARYFVADVPDEDSGGFHSKYAVGYHHVFRAGCTATLNAKLFPNKPLRTVEFVRNYLHDSVHHSTFCSFRRLIRFPKNPDDTKRVMPEVYREQYGINFRNSTEMSYSSPKLTHRVPLAINLNLLMDGVGVDLITSALNRANAGKLVAPSNAQEKSILDEVLLRIKEQEPCEWGSDFYFEVILNTRKFLGHWGGEAFRMLLCHAMFSGKLDDLTAYFTDKYGEPDAWEKVFRRPGFTLDQ